MPELNSAELAARYGWSLAVLNSSPDLANLFSQAVAGTWTAEKFTAELRNTQWFKQNGEAARQAIILKSSDPATWNQRVQSQRMAAADIAVQMGAQVPGAAMQDIAESIIMYGWNEQQVRRAMAGYIKYAGGQLWGQAQTNESELRKYAASMGVKVSAPTIEKWAADSSAGVASLQSYMGTIQNLAESTYPQFQERFNNGETFDQIASPYKQSMAALLELSPEAIDNFDPTIRGALSGKDAKTGQPAMKTVWEFENDLRKDKRWLKTSNAQDDAMTVTNRVLKDMGVIS